MQVFRSWHWSVLAVTFGFTTQAAQAGMITPDSIPNPPSAVDSANGTPVFSNNLVTTQYAGVGLNFFDRAAVTRLNGISVWVPTGVTVSNAALAGRIDYAWGVGGNFLSPGSFNPGTVSSLSVTILGGAGVSVYGLHNQILNIAPSISSTADAQVWTFNAPGISSFSTIPPISGQWGVAEVTFTPASAPEPSSLVLAGLGALGLATRLRWRCFRPFA